jgi:hypothetical protein
MRIAVQRLVVEWTTDSRGGPGAARRNAVPSSLVLPGLPDADDTALVHTVRFDEHAGFTPAPRSPEVVATRELATPLGELEIADEGPTVRIRFRWSTQLGAPRRSDGAPVRVRHGEWCRVLHNGRRPLESRWIYTQHVLNIGFDLADRRAFRRTPPAVVSDHREVLW